MKRSGARCARARAYSKSAPSPCRLLRILRELDADDARRVRRRDARAPPPRTPRRRRRAPVEAAREVPEHGSAPREAVPSDADERTALRRPAARRERADTVRALVLKVRTVPT